jgi:hypothetical protein
MAPRPEFSQVRLGEEERALIAFKAVRQLQADVLPSPPPPPSYPATRPPPRPSKTTFPNAQPRRRHRSFGMRARGWATRCVFEGMSRRAEAVEILDRTCARCLPTCGTAPWPSMLSAGQGPVFERLLHCFDTGQASGARIGDGGRVV